MSMMRLKALEVHVEVFQSSLVMQLSSRSPKKSVQQTVWS